MRAALLTAVMLLAIAALWLWFGGGMDRVAIRAAQGQREFQNAIAGALRQVRTGDAGTLPLVSGVCFAYGFFHAVGPGHGKILIGGYGVATRVTLMRLSMLAVISSLAQGLSAILMVLGGILLFDLSRKALVGITEDHFAPASYAAIGLIGLWLLLRSIRKLWAMCGAAHHPHPDHDQGKVCHRCNHRHVPTMEEASSLTSWKEAALLIGAIAVRPCTGALFLLIICWRMDMMATGIAGTFAMALGTASMSVVVAFASVIFREGARTSVGDSRTAQFVAPVLELAAGLIVAIVATRLFLRTIA
ncbi:MAG: hypothetical protein GDA53_04050 [Rhodobacteraceae bacterium]|nr:hypothetical protein [Paracoccaceae bacterium]